MSATAIAMLIARFGIPLAQQIWETIKKNDEPTPEMWAELRALNSKTLQDRIDEAAGS